MKIYKAPKTILFIFAISLAQLIIADVNISDTATSTTLEVALEEVRAKYSVPRLAAATISGGEVTQLAAVGLRRQGHPEQLTTDDLFHIGSCTKAMTSVMLARLVERDLLSWETTLVEAFPDFTDEMNEAYRPVTLDMLLHHVAGLPANPMNLDLWEQLNNWEGTTTSAREEVASVMLAQEPVHTPGTKHLYSNTGYMIAGLVAERATGKSWETLMENEVFEPLGITEVGFGPPGSADSTEQPSGHQKRLFFGLSPAFHDNPPALGPAGRVHISLTDWVKFAALWLSHNDTPEGFLRPETIEKLLGPQKDDYAAGWIVAERGWGGGTVYMHGGSNTYWYAVIWVAPEIDAAFLAATNAGSGFKACDAAIGKLIEMNKK